MNVSKRFSSPFGGEKAGREYPFNLRLTKPPTFPPIFFYSQLRSGRARPCMKRSGFPLNPRHLVVPHLERIIDVYRCTQSSRFENI